MPVLPVYLVTGFLGGGKTTLLRNLAAAHPDKRMMFLVNELSETDVDAGRLTPVNRDVHAVVGGSIFCECKAADFLSMLREDVMPVHRKDPLDALIIETSGIADPSAIGTLIEKAGYGEDLKVLQIATVLSPARFRKLQGRLPVFDAQLEAADLILINKTDLAAAAEREDCLAAVQKLHPGARVVECTHCEHVPFFGECRKPPLPDAAFAKCGDLKFVSETLSPPPFPGTAEMEAFLGDLAKTSHRVKGSLQAAGKSYEVDATPEGFQFRESSETAPGIIVIKDKEIPALITCDVFKEELERLPDLPETVIWLPMGLHDRPLELKAKLQQEIDRLEASHSEVTKILLLYGICGGGVDGLRTSRCTLVLPRTHDCIALLLGSNQQHQQIQKECPGTYFYAPGWIREKRVPGPERESWLRKQYQERYDEDMIDELVEVDAECFAHYEKALFIRTPASGDEEETCKKCAKFMDWKFEAVEGDPAWLRDFLNGAEDPERFKVLNPGEVLIPSGDENLFK